MFIIYIPQIIRKQENIGDVNEAYAQKGAYYDVHSNIVYKTGNHRHENSNLVIKVLVVERGQEFRISSFLE